MQEYSCMGFLFRILLFFSCKVCGSPQPCGPGADVPVPILGIRFRVLLVLFLQEKNKLSRPQSWRMASRALIRTALLAGRIPDTRPTRVANTSAAAMSHAGI